MTIPKIWKRITFLSVLTLITNSYTAAKEIINIPLQSSYEDIKGNYEYKNGYRKCEDR